MPARSAQQLIWQTAQVQQPTPFERFGGHAAFDALTRAFYDGVATDAPLRAMYPEADLGPARDRLRWFLEQYFGGPHTYSQQRGHPRLRMRHATFAVTPDMRDRWLRHMLAAVDTLSLAPADDALLRGYLRDAAHFLVNADDAPPAIGPDAADQA